MLVDSGIYVVLMHIEQGILVSTTMRLCVGRRRLRAVVVVVVPHVPLDFFPLTNSFLDDVLPIPSHYMNKVTTDIKTCYSKEFLRIMYLY